MDCIQGGKGREVPRLSSVLMAWAIAWMCGRSLRWGRLAEDYVGKDDEVSSGHIEYEERLRHLRDVKQVVVDHYAGSWEEVVLRHGLESLWHWYKMTVYFNLMFCVCTLCLLVWVVSSVGARFLTYASTYVTPPFYTHFSRRGTMRWVMHGI